MITKYQIDMLNVGDADAFVVYYETNHTQKHLVLIDAGRYGDGEHVLHHLNTYYGGIPVELAIVTHPDDDHYGGFVYLLEQIQSKRPHAIGINMFWLNDPRRHISIDDVEEAMQRTTLERRLNEIYALNDTNLVEQIESMGIPHQEAFARTYERLHASPLGTYPFPECCSSEQEGFIILGPTKAYYKEQCKNFRYEHVHVAACESDADVIDRADFEETATCLSRVLDEAEDDNSNHNRSSIIVLFEPEYGKRYLFTGDASVDSFENMTITHRMRCKDLKWLKVPHHGSKHNLNSKWIKHFSPKTAYISTLKRGQYLNQCVVNALKKIECKVISTHNNADFGYIVHENILNRNLGEVNYC